ncbi:uncharacterized protein LOC116342598 [Contarinia nasturtii]|uniref:uncharacterized protein LOC116342598 n=1 Tax=Contarinia nasturtii TaxID=265458 RepID=UPI0012D4B2ED|nr:uncharacterized protein LOC116342598 [Contarinia nasturtii]
MSETKIFSNCFVILILLERCVCLTVYDLNYASSNPFGDSTTYQQNEQKNDAALYRFGYKVNAIETGDMKQHIETRLKNEVKGSIYVIEPNGVSRYVQYVANSNGFNAIVRQQFGSKYSKNFSSKNAIQTVINNKIQPYLQSKAEFDGFPRVEFEQSGKYPHHQSDFTEMSANRLDSIETSTKQAITSRQQYQVNDPEVDIDIRRSVPMIFLDLQKLKKSRKQETKNNN